MKLAEGIVLAALVGIAAAACGKTVAPEEAMPAGESAASPASVATSAAATAGDATIAQRDLLVPSAVSGDDCTIGASIRVAPDDAMRRLDRSLCEARVQPQHRDNCIAAAGAREEIVFVDDHCAPPDDPIEVSLGGRRYDVRRVGAGPEKPPFLAGTFEGDGLRMQVVPGKVVDEQFEEAELVNLEQEVEVTLTIDNATRTIQAVYRHGP